MLFTQIEFAVFYAIVLLFMIVVRSNNARKWWLLGASMYFYGYWDVRFLALLAFSTVIDFYVALAIERTEDPVWRKRWLIVSLCTNLGVLGFFKYFNFFISSAGAILAPLGFEVQTLNIVLPIGISFFTFQTLSYTIDIYCREIPACRSLRDFAMFVAFFPQLVAGPIVRARDFLPQLNSLRPLSFERGLHGFRQFTLGLFKKIFIADGLSGFVNSVFAGPELFDGATVWLAVIGFSIQIYCDFSGYSDMAIGLARVLGYDFPENFRMPYLATSVADFWHRWHISLSTWLRDYLYIPLGGSRGGERRTYINLMLTMLLGGLWHGAAWVFVIWGGLHGAALGINRMWSLRESARNKEPKHPLATGIETLASWVATMLVVIVGWVFFRSTDGGLPQALTVLDKMFLHPLQGVSWIHPFVVGIIGLMALLHALAGANVFPRARRLPLGAWYTPVVIFLMLWVIVVFPAKEFAPFIYFQF